jgi:hypothetical protein
MANRPSPAPVERPPSSSMCGQCMTGHHVQCLVSSPTHPTDPNGRQEVRWNTCSCYCNDPEVDHPKNHPRRWP